MVKFLTVEKVSDEWDQRGIVGIDEKARDVLARLKCFGPFKR